MYLHLSRNLSIHAGDVVAIVTPWRWVERQQPQGVDPQLRDVIEFADQARKIADSVAMLYGGRIIWQGPRAGLDSSGNPYVDQFVHGRAEGPIPMQLKRG